MRFSRFDRSFCFLRVLAALIVGSLLPAAAQEAYRAKVAIVAGPTIQVSSVSPNLPAYENLAAGDPIHPGRLLSCVHEISTAFGKDFDQQCYGSFDDGQTWQPVLRVTEGTVNGDPTIAYGQGDDVYVVALVLRNPDHILPPDPNAPPVNDENTVVFKSTDGGHTFSEVSRFGFIDREFIAVDTTHGKYAGRVYVAGQGSFKDILGQPGRSSIHLWRSLDGGKTFLGPIQAAYPQGSIIFGVGTGAVLSDGTYVIMFGLSKPGQTQSMNADGTPNAELHVITSSDGGETFNPSQKIADVVLDRPRSEGGILTELAADPGSRYFKDRLYAVFPEVVDNRIQIGFSYSADKGKTWSKPIVVNDDRSPIVHYTGTSITDRGPDHLLPSVAVNKDGVVLVTWYDRRNAADNLGWQLRAAASLDGGETFSASVPVTPDVDAYSAATPWDVDGSGSTDSTHSMISMYFGIDAFYVSGGHTSGIAVDSAGVFHPTWLDNHTGVSQLWTTAITVNGNVVKHGAPDLAGLEDVSKSVTLELANPQFNRGSGLMTVAAQLMNTSAHRIVGPIKLRVVSMESGIGVPEITNADNGEHGTGAVWNFTAEIPSNGLGSLKRSHPKTLTFRVYGVRALGQGRDFQPSLFSFDAHVYGRIARR